MSPPKPISMAIKYFFKILIVAFLEGQCIWYIYRPKLSFTLFAPIFHPNYFLHVKTISNGHDI